MGFVVTFFGKWQILGVCLANLKQKRVIVSTRDVQWTSTFHLDSRPMALKMTHGIEL
jgi:hypothetical protein